jgi:cytochrome o ubiquinol oxidase subunit III
MSATEAMPMSPGETSPAGDIPISQRGPASPRVVAGFGFWLFLLSDIIMFSTIFAAYAVLVGETAGAPSGRDLFNLDRVKIETFCLLASSFTCGLMAMSIESQRKGATFLWAGATFVLGAAFIAIELNEFAGMVANGAGPTHSAFLSAFFMLVGTHGLHVSFGLVWLVVMMAQVATLGFRPMVMRRLLCFSLYWHALDIVWVALFTVVYLGAN